MLNNKTCVEQLIISAYIQAAVTAVYALIFILSPTSPSIALPMTVAQYAQSSLKGTVPLILEFSRQLSLAMVISAIIVQSDAYDNNGIHTQKVVGHLAMTFSITVLIFEVIFSVWFQPKGKQHLFIPCAFSGLFLCLVVRSTTQEPTQADSNNPFFRFCFDFERGYVLDSQLHDIIIPAQVVASVMFILWVVLETKKFSNCGIQRLKRVIRSLLVVWLLCALGLVLYTFTNHRNVIAANLGTTNQEAKWSFGQIVPLTAWLHVIIDFALIVFCRGE